jgi:glycyl-tRNA synthetase alpha chain
VYEKECVRLVELGLVMPAYDFVMKCSHTFNLLDARRAISVSERTAVITRVRRLARKIAEAFLKQREEMGYPLMKGKAAEVLASQMKGSA